jgi:hypothetical protein
MRANVYSSYTVLSRWAKAVYGAFCKLVFTNNLTDGVGFEPTVRYERTHTFQTLGTNAANRYRRSVSAVRDTLLRSLRSKKRPESGTSRIQIVYSAPTVNRFSKEFRDDLERAVRDEFRQFSFRKWN